MTFEKIRLKNILLLTAAGIINAIGVTMFLSPVNLYDSGISGTSMLLAQITPSYLPLSLFLLLLNLPLFLYGAKKQGMIFTFYAVYTVIIYSLAAWIITYVLPVDVNLTSPLGGNDLLLCALFGGLISGTGSGLAIRFGGAMDGIEVMAVIFAKRLSITVGTFVMIYNVFIYILCGIIFKDWTLSLYSMIAYGAGIKTVDFVVEGLDRSKAAMIITLKPNEICDALSDAFGSGATKINAVGSYSNTDRTVVYFVMNRFQIGKLKAIVTETDPCAYITISEVADVFKSNM